MIYLLQENRATTKVQEGEIFTCQKTFFTWARIERREERKRGKRRSWKRRKIRRRMEMRRRRKMRRRRMKRRCKALVMKVRSFTCPKTFLLFLVTLLASFIGWR